MNRELDGARVLAIDDDAQILDSYAMILEAGGAHVATAETLDAGLRLAATRPFDVCLLDRAIGFDSGVEAIPGLAAQAPGLRIVMATAHRDTDAALEALRVGAHDYLVKPFSPEQLRIAIARQVEARRLSRRVESLERQQPARHAATLAPASPRMREVMDMLRQVADTDANVLILGESGTGKNVLAEALHRASPRAGAEFATVNCPSLSADLLENELFGHRKGAFTGADDHAEGRVAAADGGTLFLDEIGDFPLSLQPKLLRFIQEKRYERVGDPTTRSADVRLVAATNRDLAAMARDGSFRQDLYYRINVVSVTVPPLRERREDIVPLAEGFIARYAGDYGRPARALSDEARAALEAYAWPGNVRELQNVVERAVILCPTETLGRAHLAIDAAAPPAPASATASATASEPSAAVAGGGGAVPTLRELERRHIEAVLAQSDTLDAAARMLGIDASTLYRKRKAYGLG